MNGLLKYNFGAAIKFYRKQKHLSQQELADRSRVNRNTLACYEGKGNQIPNAIALKSISDVFGISCDDMLEAARMMADLENKEEH